MRRSAARGRSLTLTKHVPGARRAGIPASSSRAQPPRAPPCRITAPGSTRSSTTAIAPKRTSTRGNAPFFTRNGYDWTARFRQIAEALRPLEGHDLVLDGEIVVMDERGISDFHLLQDELAQKAPRTLDLSDV